MLLILSIYSFWLIDYTLHNKKNFIIKSHHCKRVYITFDAGFSEQVVVIRCDWSTRLTSSRGLACFFGH